MGPPPWDGFDPVRDLAAGRFVFTLLLAGQSAGADPTLRHHAWAVDFFDVGAAEEAGARRIEEAAAASASELGMDTTGVHVRVTPVWGPGVGAARARVLRIGVEVARPAAVDQTALVAWIGGAVRAAAGGERGRGGQKGEEEEEAAAPLTALVLEELVFREGGGGGGGREWVVRDPYVQQPLRMD